MNQLNHCPTQPEKENIRFWAKMEAYERYPHWWQSLHRAIFRRGFIVGAWHIANLQNPQP
jgi:hypothetical protein